MTARNVVATTVVLLLVACSAPKESSFQAQVVHGLTIASIMDEYSESLEVLAEDPDIIATASQASHANRHLSLEQIKATDVWWIQALEEDILVESVLNNAVALRLLEFQDAHVDFSEIFITDNNGLNIAQTNKTSDYYQADEAWWRQAYAGGKGQAYYGHIEFDESTNVEAISVYLPIYNDENVVGILKAVVSVAAIQRQFWR